MWKDRISLAQMSMITVAGFSVMSLFAFPGDLVREAGRSALLAVMIAWILALATTGALMALAVRFPGQTVVEYAQAILGRWLGIGTVSLLALFHLTLAAIVAENYARVAHTMFLPRTPDWVLLVAVLGVSGYVANLGLQSLGRTCELFVPFVYILFLLILVVGMSRLEVVQLQPSLPLGWGPVAMGVLRTFYPFLGPQNLYLHPAFLDRPPRRAVPWAFLAVGLNIGLVAAVCLLTIGILGIDASGEVRFPAIFAIQLLFIPGFFVENVGYAVAIAWTILVCLFVSVQLWGLSMVTYRMSGIGPRWRSWLIVGYGLILLGFRLVFAPQRDLGLLLSHYISPLGLAASLLVPTILLGVAGIRRIRGPMRDRPGQGEEPRPAAIPSDKT